MSVLEVRKLTKYFGALKAVNDVSFSLLEGEILGVIGPNGAGKTTIFNSIAGVHRPTSGRIYFQERDITGMKPHRICRLGVAKTSQSMEPFQAMTVFDNVRVGALFGGQMNTAEAQRVTEEIVALVRLAGEKDKLASTLSVPSRRRLELARALATGAKVLLLDECMAGLNPQEIEEALDLIRAIRDSGKSLIVVEHVMRAVMGISDRIVVLNYGAKVAEGTPGEVASNEQVIEAYLGRKLSRRRTA